MSKKTVIIIISVIGVLALAAGLGVLIWWLVTDTSTTDDSFIIELEGDGIGDVEFHAAFTRISGAGDMFWWFYPTISNETTSRPIILWLDGVTGIPPSLLANFGMFGPYDFNLNRRSDSWVDDYNLLFVDAPIGTGFSTAANNDGIPSDLEENTEHLLFTLETFYSRHENYKNTPLYIFGQGSGAQLALFLAAELYKVEHINHSLKGVVIGNGIVSPALALTKLGFYLEELGYIDGQGRDAIENFSIETNSLVDKGNLGDAFDKFLSLGDFVDENAGAVAINIGHIVEKLIRDESTRDNFGQKKYLQDLFNVDTFSFMEEVVAPALGVSNDATYDEQREAVLGAFRGTFMESIVYKIEDILQNTDLEVTIYNGNLDAVSNTPGQLEWVNKLQWNGQEEFLNSPRQTLVVNRLLEGYIRETDRLKFYWMNVAGQSVPLDNPVAMRRVLRRITDE